uniref:Protein kinase domain-containing protein n=1 Tax=Glossina pallidipes TaxID=7398 RepID=A0A1A9ZY29_GLOPL
MGAHNSSTRSDTNLYNNNDDVNFDHFQILRAIGKGSFGKVCIVQKRGSGVLYAMKYVSRSACESRGALGGVIKEVELLASLEHPFLVNLWFSFQDEEDLFMVCDLLTGGDLRYHLQNRVEFSEESVALLVCELGSALDYLQNQRVVHRDVKPDNILLDSCGHAHLTDFNIATRLAKDGLACSMSGTKPYMAPEVFMCALDELAGYTFPVDWWSLGVVAYEMRANIRPFPIHSNTAMLLCVHPGARMSSQHELQQTPLLRHIDFSKVLKKQIKPSFKPPEDHLNCDPCLELEEMIIETRPLHKKKKRLAKQRSAQKDSDPERVWIKEYIAYNRFKELKRKDMERKETEWERELQEAMANSVVTSLTSIAGPISTPAKQELPKCNTNAETVNSSNAAKSKTPIKTNTSRFRFELNICTKDANKRHQASK